jgi:hypothetical protein
MGAVGPAIHYGERGRNESIQRTCGELRAFFGRNRWRSQVFRESALWFSNAGGMVADLLVPAKNGPLRLGLRRSSRGNIGLSGRGRSRTYTSILGQADLTLENVPTIVF